jgi:hypothetical protein
MHPAVIGARPNGVRFAVHPAWWPYATGFRLRQACVRMRLLAPAEGFFLIQR